ncbi:MAG: hypothetical protein H6718_00005 [Polyangiaceae bacterium]|nr:hypothetical protein [Polyangiaceae bacterium]
MKPTKHLGDRWRGIAAREKIASDLAFEMKAAVPPVVLTDRSDAEAGEEVHACVSLQCYEHQWSWASCASFLARSDSPVGAAMARTVGEDVAAVLVMNHWVGQTEHNDHPHNIIWGYDDPVQGPSSFVFVDYATSLGFGGAWEGGRGERVARAPFPDRLRARVTPHQLDAALDRLESLRHDVIEEVCMRLPPEFMCEHERLAVLSTLLARRALVRAIIKGYD